MISQTFAWSLRLNSVRITARCYCSVTSRLCSTQNRTMHHPFQPSLTFVPNFNRNSKKGQSSFHERNYLKNLLYQVRQCSNLPDNENKKGSINPDLENKTIRPYGRYICKWLQSIAIGCSFGF